MGDGTIVTVPTLELRNVSLSLIVFAGEAQSPSVEIYIQHIQVLQPRLGLVQLVRPIRGADVVLAPSP